MTETRTYSVTGMHCGHCARSIREEVSTVAGVQAVDVDLEDKTVTIQGDNLTDEAIRTAIAAAGYEAT